MKLTIAAVAAVSASVAFADTAHLVHRFTLNGTLADSVQPGGDVVNAEATKGEDDSYTLDNKGVHMAGGNCWKNSFIRFPSNLIPTDTHEATVEIFFKPISRPNWSKLFFCGVGQQTSFGFSLRYDNRSWERHLLTMPATGADGTPATKLPSLSTAITTTLLSRSSRLGTRRRFFGIEPRLTTSMRPRIRSTAISG